MPNSLIFVVILAVWAAYLIQHWIRRRDHVATARSVDRFSEAMRVLERRQSMPRADISTPKQRSYSVSLTRPAHPDVVVKRARKGAPSAPPRGAARRLRQLPSAAALRGVALLAGALALVAGIAFSVVGRSWWGALAGVAVLLLAVTFVRFSVESTRRRAASSVRSRTRRTVPTAQDHPVRPAARRTGARRPSAEPVATRPAAARHGHADRPADRRPTQRRRTTVAAPRTTAPVGTPAASAAPSTPSGDEGAAPARATELYDVEALESTRAQTTAEAHTTADAHTEGTDAAPVAPEVEAAPGTWAPVPVPPPTYTLKARAPRRAEPRSEGAGSERSQRPVEDLPFDGHALALDEEFEDLPPVHSAG